MSAVRRPGPRAPRLGDGPITQNATPQKVPDRAAAPKRSPAHKRRLARERERRRLLRLHRYENAARSRGFVLVGGIDEVGRGPLAGPVVAACVVADGPLMLRGLDDSKRVIPERRVELAEHIRKRAVAWAVGVASVAEIERLNIYWASLLAMERALASLAAQPEYLLTDAVRIRAFAGEQLPVIKGDAKCATVAAASIVAKVCRDEILVELDREYPQYGFAEHKGYATPRHIVALREHGPCRHHRRGFWRVRDAETLFDAATASAVAELLNGGEPLPGIEPMFPETSCSGIASATRDGKA